MGCDHQQHPEGRRVRTHHVLCSQWEAWPIHSMAQGWILGKDAGPPPAGCHALNGNFTVKIKIGQMITNSLKGYMYLLPQSQMNLRIPFVCLCVQYEGS